MSVAKVTEVISSSTVSFDDAIKKGVERANKTLKNVKGAWVEQQKGGPLAPLFFGFVPGVYSINHPPYLPAKIHAAHPTLLDKNNRNNSVRIPASATTRPVFISSGHQS